MDIRIANHGSIVILYAISEAARKWLDESLAGARPSFTNRPARTSPGRTTPNSEKE